MSCVVGIMLANLALQGGGNAIALLFGLLTFVVFVAMVVWTYTDAKQNSSHPAFLWAVVVFFAPFLGIILYVLLGRNR